MKKKPKEQDAELGRQYDIVLGDISDVIAAARRSAARSVNSIMTAAYWLIGRRIVEYEQEGKKRAQYGEELLKRLSADLGKCYGRGFGVDNLQRFRAFYLIYPSERIYATLSRKLPDKDQTEKYAIPLRISSDHAAPPKGQTLIDKTGLPEKEQTASAELNPLNLASCFPLPWSAYVRLLSVKNDNARRFYEEEARRGGWTVRQLDRQINSQFYERTALSRNKAAMLTKGQKLLPEDRVLPEEEIKDPFVLEFLGLKDEYSESDLEEALIRHLETFLLELGSDFCFIGRQKRLRIGDEWYRVDLVFFHRRLRCLVIIDLKIGKFTHADAGQMHLYLNYAREHWIHEGENPPVGLILCAQKNEAVARYALEGLPNKVMASEYRTALPDEKELAAEIERTQALLQARKRVSRTDPMVRLTERLIETIPLFQALTEKSKTSISNRSRKLFTMSSIHQATRRLLRKEKGEAISPDEEKLAIDFWNEVIANIPDWTDALERKTTPAALRQKYVHAHGITLQALAIAGNNLIRLHPGDWQQRLRGIRTLDWRRANTILWEGKALVGGRMSRYKHSLTLTADVIMNSLGLPIDHDEAA
ncbi:MAG: PDDEXK nuclease domain-containing protein, partial [Desulfobacterales bacterium]|nr:PDDEXK nuclease domain-containing protein [Desulfobacterales bacterium]